MFRYVFTGYTDRPHTLGAELASLRELLFPETKQHFWQQMLDAAAPVQVGSSSGSSQLTHLLVQPTNRLTY